MAAASSPAATASALWQPRSEGVRQVLDLFQGTQSPDQRTQELIFHRLQELNQYPEFCNYLTCVFANQEHPTIVRYQAGLHLKNSIRRKATYERIPPAHLQYITESVVRLIGDHETSIRNTSGSILTTIALRAQLQGWMPVLMHLLKMLDNVSDLAAVDGAFGALAKICEDMPHLLLHDEGQLGRPLNYMVPKFIAFMVSPHVSFRRYAVGALNRFLVDMPQELLIHFDNFLSALFRLTEDADVEVRKGVLTAITTITEVAYDRVAQHMKFIFNFIIVTTQDPDLIVGKMACEFWNIYMESTVSDKALLCSCVSHLVPMLLSSMRYSRDEIIQLENKAEDDSAAPDRAEDIAPRHHKSRNCAAAKGKGGDDEVAGEESDLDDGDAEAFGSSDDDGTEWTLRKSAALALEYLARLYRKEVAAVVLPLIQAQLGSAEWPARESAILALGAVSDGLFETLKPYLPTLVPLLLSLLRDPQPFVRSIACFALGRYSSWIAQTSIGDDTAFFAPLLKGLMELVVDKNKMVQSAACSALATFAEQARDRLLTYMESILQCLMGLFSYYQQKNQMALYDVVATLVENMKPGSLNQERYISILIPPLMGQWNALDSGADIRMYSTFFECLAAVTMALGPGFAPFAQPVIGRCMEVIELTLSMEQQVSVAQQGGHDVDDVDTTLVACSLDLACGVIESLKASSAALSGGDRLVNLVFQCMSNADDEVRQSAFALFGEIVKSVPDWVRVHIPQYIQSMLRNLDPQHPTVCNNAAWSAGETAAVVGGEVMEPYASAIMNQLAQILQLDGLHSDLLETVAVTAGRLAMGFPSKCAPFLSACGLRWCFYLGRVDEHSVEGKESAFHGLCSVVERNPHAMASDDHFQQLCRAFASWENPPVDVLQHARTVLLGYKQFFDGQAGTSWAQVMSSLKPPEVALYIARAYQVP